MSRQCPRSRQNKRNPCGLQRDRECSSEGMNYSNGCFFLTLDNLTENIQHKRHIVSAAHSQDTDFHCSPMLSRPQTQRTYSSGKIFPPEKLSDTLYWASAFPSQSIFYSQVNSKPTIASLGQCLLFRSLVLCNWGLLKPRSAALSIL